MNKISKEKIVLSIAYLLIVMALVVFFVQTRMDFLPQLTEESHKFQMLYQIMVSVRFGCVFFVATLLMSYFAGNDNVRLFFGFILVEYIIHLSGVAMMLKWVDKLYLECFVQLMFYLLAYVTIPAVFAYIFGRVCIGIRNDIGSVMSLIGIIAIFNYEAGNVIFALPLINSNPQLVTGFVKYFSIFNVVSADDLSVTVNINPYAPFVVPQSQWLIMIAWTGIALAVLLCQRKKKVAIAGAILASVLAIALVDFSQNEYYVKRFGTFAEPLNVMDSWDRERLYYENVGMTDVDMMENFSVKEYRIEIKTGNVTQVNVEMIPDKVDLDRYVFTLHHDFNILSVKDEKGNELKFDVNGDYITVYNDNELEGIVMEYKGTGCIYMAGKEYTYFPQYYKYYPVAGIYEVFDLTKCDYVKNEPEELARYHVTIDADYKIYSNLNEVEPNVFEGEDTGVLLLGGCCVGEVSVDSAKIIYPALEYDEEYAVDCYEELVAEYDEMGIELDGKDWFVSPYMAATFENHYNGMDYFTGSYQEVKWIMPYDFGMRYDGVDGWKKVTEVE